MSTLDRASHATRRRGPAPHYTAANLMLYQPEMQQHVLELTSVDLSFSVLYLPHSDHSTGSQCDWWDNINGMPLLVPTAYA